MSIIRVMEFLIAASLSDRHCGPTNNMLDMYLSGDPYLVFAKRVGAVPSTATKKSHETCATDTKYAASGAVWHVERTHWPLGLASQHLRRTRC